MSVSLRAINVLLVDDELAQMELTREALIDADSMLEITTVELPSNAFILFKERDFDCVVSDYQMPEMDGIQFCKKIRETSEVPFIIYTGKGSDEVASAAFGAGASDYVRKEKELAHYKVLAKRIRLAAEKYRSDKALRDREEQIIGIFESITDGFVSLDGGWRYIYVNRAAEKSLKTEKEELVGNVLWNYWPDPPEEFKNALTEAAITKTPKMAEFYYPFLNSWFQINVYPSDTGVNVYFQDVSERKRAEEELRSASIIVQEERDRLKSLVDSMQDEVWFADTSGKFTLANPSAVTEFKLDGLEVGVEELARSLEVCRPDGSLRPAEESPPLQALRGEVVHNQEEVVRTPATGEIR